MLVIALAMISTAPTQPVFTPEERAAVVQYWNAPGRYTLGLPAAALTKGPWQVRLTPDASRWFWSYQRAIAGPGKPPPNMDVKAPNPDWERWIQAKLDFDRWSAQTVADAANARLIPSVVPLAAKDAPPAPGPAPVDLVEKVGNPPPFAAAVVPMEYAVTFEDGDRYAFTDNPNMRPRYAYYRSANGVMDPGRALRNMTDAELDPLFEQAGMMPSEARAAKAVSRLEGGFDAVNTYDTGWVSIGFIQCIAGERGDGSLMDVLAAEKGDNPEAYAADFRRFGIDISPQRVLVVVDPATGAELTGSDAVRKVIEDKRLTAVFQKAGRRSTAFRVAQVKVAKTRYWPADDPFTVKLDGQTLTGRVADIIRSEAGMATLFDRKVNRGTIEPFAEVVERIMRQHGCRTLEEAARYEREIVAALKYRADFLQDPSLSKPE